MEFLAPPRSYNEINVDQHVVTRLSKSNFAKLAKLAEKVCHIVANAHT